MPKIDVMLIEPVKENESKLVQIMNEIDELAEAEKSFVLYWLRAKKNVRSAAQADLTIVPNDLTYEDIYKERNTLRQQKA